MPGVRCNAPPYAALVLYKPHSDLWRGRGRSLRYTFGAGLGMRGNRAARRVLKLLQPVEKGWTCSWLKARAAEGPEGARRMHRDGQVIYRAAELRRRELEGSLGPTSREQEGKLGATFRHPVVSIRW